MGEIGCFVGGGWSGLVRVGWGGGEALVVGRVVVGVITGVASGVDSMMRGMGGGVGVVGWQLEGCVVFPDLGSQGRVERL